MFRLEFHGLDAVLLPATEVSVCKGEEMAHSHEGTTVLGRVASGNHGR